MTVHAERPSDVAIGTDMPLSGVRIIDLTMVWAGPFATKHLADLGAEVIKIEGPTRVDLTRSLTIPDQQTPRPYDTSRYFNEYNRNKLGMAVDLQNPSGRAIVHKLAAISDVLIENFRPGVIDRLGLSYDELSAINPRIIVVSLPGYSDIPPERGLPAYGPNVEQMGGLAYFNGYLDGPPQKSGISYGDPMAGLGGAAAVLMALVQRDRTGVGQYIEVGQRNVLIGLVGDAIVAHQLGAEFARTGNRSPLYAPQGVYRCRAEALNGDGDASDAWVAISVISDEQWRALCQVLGRLDLVDDPCFIDVLARQRAHDRLDALLAAWAIERSPAAATRELQAHGIPAGPVLDPRGLRDDPQLQARGFLQDVEHPQLKTMRLTSPTWHFAGVDQQLHTAPLFGEHNRLILAERLGYEDDAIVALEAAGVIASVPRA